MKFSFVNRGSLEITGIKKVVVNSVTINGKVKEKEGKTYVWELAHVKKGFRWLKYEMGSLQGNKSPEELRALILDGASQGEVHDSIMEAMTHPAVHVWFSGDTCNIEVNLTLIRNQQAERKRALHALLIAADRLANRARRKLEEAKELEKIVLQNEGS
jgi:hypothetical protein